MRIDRTSSTVRRIAGVTAAALLALPLAACSSDDDKSSDSKPEPVAAVTDLSGQSTAVTLDPGFVKALTHSSSHRVSSATRPWPTAPSASPSPGAT